MLSGVISIDDAYPCIPLGFRIHRLFSDSLRYPFSASTCRLSPHRRFSASVTHLLPATAILCFHRPFLLPPPVIPPRHHSFFIPTTRFCGRKNANVSVGGNFECAQMILEVHCWVWQWYSAVSRGCPCFPGRKGKKLECRAYNWALRNNRTVDSTMSPWLRMSGARPRSSRIFPCASTWMVSSIQHSSLPRHPVAIR